MLEGAFTCARRDCWIRLLLLCPLFTLELGVMPEIIQAIEEIDWL